MCGLIEYQGLLGGDGNHFKGGDIKSLQPGSGILAEYWILELKNGAVLHLALDWRGQDAYIGLYKT